MKKLLTVLLALLIAIMPMLALAADSKESKDIPKTKVVEVVAEDKEQEVIPPKVEIVKETEETIQLQEEMQTIFNLTIRYIFVNGSTAAKTYSEALQEGTTFSVPSPVISGYTATAGTVSGTMPARNMQYTVVYLSEEEEYPAFAISRMLQLFTIEDFETPLGLGSSIVNVGICFE